MISSHPTRLSHLETECIKVLWQKRAASVAEVQSAMPRPLAYTTVMTVLDRMREKGVVERRKHGRAYVYSPALDREGARRHAVHSLLENFFNRDPQELLEFLLRSRGVEEPAAGDRALFTPRARTEIDDSLL